MIFGQWLNSIEHIDHNNQANMSPSPKTILFLSLVFILHESLFGG